MHIAHTENIFLIKKSDLLNYLFFFYLTYLKSSKKFKNYNQQILKSSAF